MTTSFITRHNGSVEKGTQHMLQKIGASSLEQLIEETIPSSIRLKKDLNLSKPLSEYQYSNFIQEIAFKNKVFKSYIGLGYYNCIVPAVIQRNILENPGWYTAYTPYQAEISQGRLEGLLNFQTMIMDLTAMDIANASLLDEATAAAEAMIMLYNSRSREATKNGVNQFLVSNECFPQTIEVLKTRSKPLDIEVVVGDYKHFHLSDKVFGAILQYPTANGEIYDYASFVEKAHANSIAVTVAADILSLALLTPPGEWGADVVVGSTQRFGLPMGYGGPHAAFFATKEEYKRNLPGRIIGVSVDASGNPALRMALQTREQHIRRDKATSNICTAQALLAIMSGMYAVYHGHKGIKAIAQKVHLLTVVLNNELKKLGYKQVNESFFDTLQISLPSNVSIESIRQSSNEQTINIRYINDETIGISLDETTEAKDITALLKVFATAIKKESPTISEQLSTASMHIPASLLRASSYLSHPIFNSYHSETEMMRYLKRLENKDVSLTHSMISLGSCTMKLNAATEMYPVSYPEFANIHPFAPKEQTAGYTYIIDEFTQQLCEITGFDAVSFQPNSGAQGEYAGLLVIRSYHESQGQGHRNIALIPASAHGTNPASAVMAGMKVIVVKCDEQGNIDIADLKSKAELHKDQLATLMVTYPSTHGVFEEGIIEINEVIHQYGGQVYMDGANMNAQVGFTNPATIGADVCHLNLHKTFAIPHGGGGPGMGPIAVKKHLTPFLPSHPFGDTPNNGNTVAAAHYGSALILLISYGYIKMLGTEGLKQATEMAILNANYLKKRLEAYFPVLYQGKNNRVAHEMIIDCRHFKKTAQIEVEDIAKRLMDYGFHAPTVSFPVPGTLMIEPTESESREELDRFCDALIAIRKEIQEIEEGKVDATDNVLKNAPHTATVATADQWTHPYSREKAVYPLTFVRENKFWVSVSRIDNAHGDRNLICSCPSTSSYQEVVEV